MNWKEHAECLGYADRGGSCNADRAEMIREGERLQALAKKYHEALWDETEKKNRYQGEAADLRAENARLREALRAIAALIAPGTARDIARAALGEMKP